MSVEAKSREQEVPVTSERQPMLCEVCGRFTVVQWHCVIEDLIDQGQCAASLSRGGNGYWLCEELCHRTAHELMVDDGGDGCALRVVGTMMRRLAEAARVKARRYERKARSGRGR